MKIEGVPDAKWKIGFILHKLTSFEVQNTIRQVFVKFQKLTSASHTSGRSLETQSIVTPVIEHPVVFEKCQSRHCVESKVEKCDTNLLEVMVASAAEELRLAGTLGLEALAARLPSRAEHRLAASSLLLESGLIFLCVGLAHYVVCDHRYLRRSLLPRLLWRPLSVSLILWPI